MIPVVHLLYHTAILCMQQFPTFKQQSCMLQIHWNFMRPPLSYMKFKVNHLFYHIVLYGMRQYCIMYLYTGPAPKTSTRFIQRCCCWGYSTSSPQLCLGELKSTMHWGYLSLIRFWPHLTSNEGKISFCWSYMNAINKQTILPQYNKGKTMAMLKLL